MDVETDIGQFPEYSSREGFKNVFSSEETHMNHEIFVSSSTLIGFEQQYIDSTSQKSIEATMRNNTFLGSASTSTGTTQQLELNGLIWEANQMLDQDFGKEFEVETILEQSPWMQPIHGGRNAEQIMNNSHQSQYSSKSLGFEKSSKSNRSKKELHTLEGFLHYTPHIPDEERYTQETKPECFISEDSPEDFSVLDRSTSCLIEEIVELTLKKDLSHSVIQWIKPFPMVNPTGSSSQDNVRESHRPFPSDPNNKEMKQCGGTSIPIPTDCQPITNHISCDVLKYILTDKKDEGAQSSEQRDASEQPVPKQVKRKRGRPKKIQSKPAEGLLGGVQIKDTILQGRRCKMYTEKKIRMSISEESESGVSAYSLRGAEGSRNMGRKRTIQDSDYDDEDDDSSDTLSHYSKTEDDHQKKREKMNKASKVSRDKRRKLNTNIETELDKLKYQNASLKAKEILLQKAVKDIFDIFGKLLAKEYENSIQEYKKPNCGILNMPNN